MHQFTLVGGIVHGGGAHGGHYQSFVQHDGQPGYTRFNDRAVSRLTTPNGVPDLETGGYVFAYKMTRVEGAMVEPAPLPPAVRPESPPISPVVIRKGDDGLPPNSVFSNTQKDDNDALKPSHPVPSSVSPGGKFKPRFFRDLPPGLKSLRNYSKQDAQGGTPFARLALEANAQDATVQYAHDKSGFYRYSNIACPADTMVGLTEGDIVNGKLSEDAVSRLYPANNVDLSRGIIACEAPRIVSDSSSVDNRAQFWDMVWTQNTSTIAMVTNLEEGGKSKCAQYWPDTEGDSVQLNKLTITLAKEVKETSEVTIRTFTVKNNEGETRTVTQFHYTGWPDHGVPGGNDRKARAVSVVNFANKVRQHRADVDGKLVVHCSAGVGRTGTFLAVEKALQAREAGVIDQFDLNKEVKGFRAARGLQTIQAEAQYELCCEAVLLVATNDKSITPSNPS
jgi:protein tyrosine phosphatase